MRVLVVDDDEKLLDFMEKALKAESYTVDIAKDGERGLFLASVNEYDVIVLDIILPQIAGDEVCRLLREKGIRTPILMLSSKQAVEDKVNNLNNGADDYMTKPFSISELSARLRVLARRKVADHRMNLIIEDLEMDISKREVRRKGKVIPLSFKEFALLEFLMRNAGKAVSRFAILENVWGSGERIITNVVDVYIRHLRKKIDTNKERKLIHTVREVGYMLH